MSLKIISFGTLLEYFDFVAFALIYKHIPFIGETNIVVQFVLGYGFRLVGSFLLVNLTKKMDTIKVLIWSIIAISISTLTIGLLPNHQWSFWVLIFCRALQGLAFAVEFPTGASFYPEEEKTAQVVSFATQGYIFASLLCGILFSLLNPQQMQTFGWRIPFLMGGTLGLFLTMGRLRAKSNIINSNKEKYFSLISITSNICLILGTIFSVFGLLKTNIPHTVITEGIKASTESKYSVIQILLVLLLLLFIYQRFITKQFKSLKETISWLRHGILLRSVVNSADSGTESDRTLVKRMMYLTSAVIFINYSMRHGLAQSYIVSMVPSLTNAHTLSLVFSALFAQIMHFRIKFLELQNLGLFLIIADFCGIPLVHWLYGFSSLLPHKIALVFIFIVNQFFITTFMVKGFQCIKELFNSRTYLIPPLYNVIIALTSYNLTKVEYLQKDFISQNFKDKTTEEVYTNPPILADVNFYFLSNLIKLIPWLVSLVALEPRILNNILQFFKHA